MKAVVEDIDKVKNFFSVAGRLPKDAKVIFNARDGYLELVALYTPDSERVVGITSKVKATVEEEGNMVAVMNKDLSKANKTRPFSITITDETGAPEVIFDAYSSKIIYSLKSTDATETLDALIASTGFSLITAFGGDGAYVLVNKRDVVKKLLSPLNLRKGDNLSIISTKDYIMFENEDSGSTAVIDFKGTMVLGYSLDFEDHEVITTGEFLRVLRGMPKMPIRLGVNRYYAYAIGGDVSVYGL